MGVATKRGDAMRAATYGLTVFLVMVLVLLFIMNWLDSPPVPEEENLFVEDELSEEEIRVPVSFNDFRMMSRGTGEGNNMILERQGFAVLDLEPGTYELSYGLEPCESPELMYTVSFPDGERVEYNPLAEEVRIIAGEIVREPMNREQRREALIREAVYSLRVSDNTGLLFREVFNNPGSVRFDTTGNTRFEYHAKCPDTRVVIKLDKIESN